MARTLMYKTPGELQKSVDAYFADCVTREKPYTMSGLGYWLGLSRQGILLYAGRKDFESIIKMARHKVEAHVEEGLMKGYNATGCIFNLKNNFDWKDKTEQDLNHSGGITVKIDRDDANVL